eukprot:415069-Pelagomonas_calceolata.AAC.3
MTHITHWVSLGILGHVGSRAHGGAIRIERGWWHHHGGRRRDILALRGRCRWLLLWLLLLSSYLLLLLGAGFHAAACVHVHQEDAQIA